MIKKPNFLLIIFFFSILTGCSSSGSLRYDQKEKTDEKSGKSVRFTSDETILVDTLYEEYTEAEDPDDMPSDETGIDITEVVKTYNNKENSSNASAELSNYKEAVLMEIIKYLNTPYKYGGNSTKGIDCSAFTQTVYANTLSLSLLRSARDQYTQGEVIQNREELEFGDLVFFNTRRRVKPGHVGIYIGDNLFAHASSKHGVIVSSLDHEYYSKRYMGGRRMDTTFQ
jgi:cell wall-associated NlpC family hydrolase